MLKKCSKCKSEKELKEFVKNKSRKDGHENICKQCHRERMKRRNANGGNFTKAIKEVTFKKYGSFCQACGSISNLQVDHKLAQILCNPNTASVEDNAWILCCNCNMVKGQRILLEVLRTIPRETLGPMLLKKYANAIVQHKFKKVLITIGDKQFTEVQFKCD